MAFRLEMDLDPGADPIGGRIVVAGRQQPFSGWIELVSLLESARQESQAAIASATGEERDGEAGAG